MVVAVTHGKTVIVCLSTRRQTVRSGPGGLSTQRRDVHSDSYNRAVRPVRAWAIARQRDR